MTPDKPRLFRMASLHGTTYAADAARRLERELATNDPITDIVHRLYLEAWRHPCFGDGLKQRLTLLLAVDTILAFAPNVAAHLEATEALIDAPKGRQ